MVQVNTENILFICGGAFDGLQQILSKRLNTQKLGFSSASTQGESIAESNLLQYVSPLDLKTYGLIPELLGRLPVVSYLNPLDATALKKILTEPKNALVKQYKKLFQMEGINLEFTDDALDCIVEKALDLKLGARGLRTICEAIVTDSMFELPSKKDVTELVIDRNYALDKLTQSKIAALKVA